MKKYWVIAMVGVGLLAIGLAGCGKKEDDAETPSTKSKVIDNNAPGAESAEGAAPVTDKMGPGGGKPVSPDDNPK